MCACVCVCVCVCACVCIRYILFLQRKMLTALETGNHKAFFELWSEVIPQHIRKSEGQKIEFYINIFFAIFPIHPLIKATKAQTFSETMPIFQRFLATKGADLSKTSAFLAFYALPYVPDPASHPSFQDLFTQVYGRRKRWK